MQESQLEKVLGHLEDKGPITPRIAVDEYNCWRLASVIYRLRDSGENIKTELIKAKNGSTYARYSLITGHKMKCPVCDAVFDEGEAVKEGYMIECPCCAHEIDLEEYELSEAGWDGIEWQSECEAEWNSDYNKMRI